MASLLGRRSEEKARIAKSGREKIIDVPIGNDANAAERTMRMARNGGAEPPARMPPLISWEKSRRP